MASFVNGVPQEHISVHDRGLLYGQNLFETISVDQKAPLLFDAHIRRLKRGCGALDINCDEDILREEISGACATLSSTEKAVLRVTITMGVGGRGYQNPEAAQGVRIISTHPFPNYQADNWSSGIVLGLSEVVLSSQARLAGVKHGNRLDQVLARSRWRPEWHEALLLDAQKRVIEATQCNVFIRLGEVLQTPELNTAGVAGVMRETILERARAADIQTETTTLSVDDVRNADEVFVSNSLIGLWPVKRFQDRRYSDFQMSNTLLNLLREHGAI